MTRESRESVLRDIAWTTLAVGLEGLNLVGHLGHKFLEITTKAARYVVPSCPTYNAPYLLSIEDELSLPEGLVNQGYWTKYTKREIN